MYQAFCTVMEKKGIQRKTGQAPGDFARMAAQKLPDCSENILAINADFEQVYYASVSAHKKSQLLDQMKQKIQGLDRAKCKP